MKYPHQLLLACLLSVAVAAERPQTIGVEVSQTTAIAIVMSEISGSFHALITESGGPNLSEHALNKHKQEVYIKSLTSCLEKATLEGMQVERLIKDSRELVRVFANLISLPAQELDTRLTALTKEMVPQTVQLTEADTAACQLHEKTIDFIVAQVRSELTASNWTIKAVAIPGYVREKALAVNAGGSNYADIEKEFLRQLVEDTLSNAHRVNKQLLNRMLGNIYYASAAQKRIAQAKRRSDDEIVKAIKTAFRRVGPDDETIEFQNIPGDIMNWVAMSANAAYEFKP